MTIQVSPADLTQLAGVFTVTKDSVKTASSQLATARAANSVEILGTQSVLSTYEQVLGQIDQAVAQIVASLACISEKLQTGSDAYAQWQANTAGTLTPGGR
jgi:type II secretory pathway component GspD/PulD (secretin)